jgi:hypothetical protein
MAAFLFVTACMALLAGLLGLVAGHMPRRTGRPQALQAPDLIHLYILYIRIINLIKNLTLLHFLHGVPGCPSSRL